jgi:hypothetical protein
VIWRDQVNPHAPEFRAVTDPLHERMFPDCGNTRVSARLGQCSGMTPERLAVSRGVSATFGRGARFGDSMRVAASWIRPR